MSHTFTLLWVGDPAKALAALGEAPAGLVVDATPLETLAETLRRRAPDAILVPSPAEAAWTACLSALPEGAGDTIPVAVHGNVDAASFLDRRAADVLPPSLSRPELAHRLKNLCRMGQLARRLAEAETLDALTGVLNRRRFMEMADLELKRANRYPAHFGLLLADVDLLQEINQVHGRAEGDRVLREIANYFKRFLRNTDLVCRYGGDEFALLLTMTDEAGTLITGERLRNGVAVAVEVAGKPVTVTLGGTHVEHARSQDLLEDLFDIADQQLYAAKAAGRNRMLVRALVPPPA